MILVAFMLAGCVSQNDDISINLPNDYPTSEIIVNKVLRSNVIVESINYTDDGGVKSKGSGVLLSEDGYILTNKHVISVNKSVESMKKADITVFVMREDYVMIPYRAEYVVEKNITQYESIDLAILKIDVPKYPIQSASPLIPIELGSVDTIRYGTPAIVIGNPKGLGILVADAMVSSPLMILEDANGNIYKYIAINSDINAGNSGGGLYDYTGKLIGIVTLREVNDQDNNADVVLGIGYAIRIDEIVEYLKAYPDIQSV